VNIHRSKIPVQKIQIVVQSIYCTVVAWDGQSGSWQFHAVQCTGRKKAHDYSDCRMSEIRVFEVLAHRNDKSLVTLCSIHQLNECTGRIKSKHNTLIISSTFVRHSLMLSSKNALVVCFTFN